MTDTQILYFLPVFIPLFFVAIWTGVTSLLGFLSGWFTLMQQYPDRDEKPVLQLNWQSGFMGGMGVNFRNVLRLGVCPSGLRVGMLRLLGPFSRDFFVPWHDIKARQKEWYFWTVTELSFGNDYGRLLIYPGTAERMAQAAHGWPEVAAALARPKT